jgi:hypothetical protein
MKPADVPETYLSLIRGGDPEPLSQLFALDAVFQGPLGLLKGREAIRQFYAGVFRNRVPQMVPGRIVIEGSKVVFELIDREAGRDAADPASAIDLMELNDAGEIQRFTVFLRPAPPSS